MLNVESGAEVATTVPFVTSFVSATPEHDSGIPTAPERFVISSYSSHHSANAFEAEGSSIIRSAVIPPVVTEVVITTQVASIPSTVAPKSSTKVVTPVHASVFQDSDSAGTVRPDVAGSSHAPGKELSLGSREDMDYEELFIEFSVVITRQACLSAELRMRIEFCLSERRRLESQLGKQADCLKFKDEEVEDLKAQILLKEAEAVEAIHLYAEASNIEAAENSLPDEVTALKGGNAILEKERDALDGMLEEFQDAQLKVVNDKLEKLYADFVDTALHLEEKFYPHLLTTIFGRRWLLTHGMELAVTKCLHSSEYLSALGAAIEKDIEKGMQDGLAARITHEDNLAKRLGLTELQPCVDQLMVPIHHSPDRAVVGANSLSFALDVSDARVRKIKENIANQRPVLPFTNTVAPITVDDYGVVGMDDRVGADAALFPNVDDAELNIP
uniref:Transposase (Putative), gypsy type n=1 Tax=Tanacetum cinerariifolium TaxID=118510 RepID=A0A6L2N282_TANCI|nr:hypothetical protein [Tanacetum cinerariifolium]